MITDTERLYDGFRGLPAGMDGSKDPPLVPQGAAYYATNVTFRGGNGPSTRPGFLQIPSGYWIDPKPQRTNSSIVGSGSVATVTTSAAHEYTTGDWVTISGADAGFNGTYKITVTGASTFTYVNTTSGAAAADGVSIRDEDYAYATDVDGTGTSKARYDTYITSGVYLQGVQAYQDPNDENPAQIVVVVDGWILALNFAERTCRRLNANDRLNSTLPVYMVQAEKYVVIQNGSEEPRVFDGAAVYQASIFGGDVVPVGKQMSYGQGRLFVVVNEGAEIIAGDIVFGGSTTSVGINDSTAANPTVITTTTPHNLVQDNLVTIRGHSSTPWINSTYAVASTPTTSTFTISKTVTSPGRGGMVTRFNAGQSSDCLRFTENKFLNEGGSLSVSSKFGKIVALSFLPVQDTATGQGDLIAFCEYGAVTFQVSAPRDQWKSSPGFQRVLFDNIGSANENVLAVNGDIFFRSTQGNGIRTYRNARAEINSYGQTSVSAEINPVLKQDTQWLLKPVSFAAHDNRLLMTCWPRLYPRRAPTDADAVTYAEEPIPTVFEGIAVLDFDSSSAGRGKSAAVFDGVWTGLRVVKLVHGLFEGNPRCFAFCLHENSGVRSHEIWEISLESEYDIQATAGPRMVNSAIVTRAYDFQDPVGLKKLIRCDLWFDNIGGGPDEKFSCELAYRPDDYPNFSRWDAFERVVKTEFLLESKNLLSYTEKIDNAEWVKTGASVVADAIEAPLTSEYSADRLVEDSAASAHFAADTSPTLVSGSAYTFSVYLKSEERDRVYLQMTNTGGAFNTTRQAWFYLSGAAGSFSDTSTGTTALIEPLDNDWYRCSVTSTTTGAGTTQCVIGLATAAGVASYTGDGASGLYVWGAQLEQGAIVTSYDADPPQLMNYDRGYAPQVKFPAPPRVTNLATETPSHLGHDFTLRVAWTGKARLGRLLLHGQRLIEMVNGGTL